MLIHFLAGSLVVLFFGRAFDFEITRALLLLGALGGIATDLIGYIVAREVKFNKWSHTHRDDFFHSIFFPSVVLVIAVLLDNRMAVAIGVAMLTHPLLDLFGIGWGVKLFYPLSKKTYKLFYKGRILVVWSQKEVDAEAERFGEDKWIAKTYNIIRHPNLFGIMEWVCFFLEAYLLFIFP